MSEHLTNRARMSRWKLLHSRDCQRLDDFYGHLAEQAKKSPKPYPGMRHNEFLVSDAEAAEALGIAKSSANKLRHAVTGDKWISVRRIPGCKKTCIRWLHVNHWKKPSKSSPVAKFESKTTKQLKKTHRFPRISSKALRIKQEKGRGNGGDSPRPSRLPSEIESHRTHPLTPLFHNSNTNTNRKHPLWFSDPLGLHCAVPGASRDASPVLYTHEGFETFLGGLVAYSRGTWNLPKLDRKVLTDRAHKARKLVLRHAAKAYRQAGGTHEQRLQAVETTAKAAILGNYQDQVERRRKGLLSGVYAELTDVFSSKSEAHMERKGWCVERGRQTMNENWVTRDRPREEGEKALARLAATKEAMKKSDPVKVLIARDLFKLRAEGKISMAEFLARCTALEAACTAS